MIEHNIKNLDILSVLAKGKHGIVYNAKYKLENKIWNKKVDCVVKTALFNSPSPNCILIESKFLLELNKHKIGPKLYYADKQIIVMQKIDGERIGNINLHENLFVARTVLRQCFLMDKLGISKDEMVNPYKHVIVSGRKVVMIDFERCSYSKRPKNVTQFCEYLRRRGFDINMQLLIDYRKDISNKTFETLLKKIK